MAAVILPCVTVSALKPSRLARMRLPSAVANALRSAVIGTEVETTEGQPPQPPSWADVTAIAPLLVAVVLASLGLVRAASALGGQSGWSDLTLGALMIASLTSLPNLITAFRLATQGRGAAVVSETYNSNSLNLIFGAFLPTIFLPSRCLRRWAFCYVVDGGRHAPVGSLIAARGAAWPAWRPGTRGELDRLRHHCRNALSGKPSVDLATKPRPTLSGHARHSSLTGL